MSKTRYLHLNRVMMLEYKLLGEAYTPDIDFSNDETFYYTKLLDGHYLIFSPNNCEVEFDNEGKAVPYGVNSEKLKTFNTLNHLAVPKDKKDAEWYTFIDNGYEFCEEDEFNSEKYNLYKKYFVNPYDATNSNKLEILNVYSKMRYDSLRLYFVQGYDFSDMMGFLCRVYVETTKQGQPYLDLCDFFINKASATKMVKFLYGEPFIIGTDVYDRYIEIKIPCLNDIWINTDDENVGTAPINDILQIRENAPLHMVMSSVESGDFELHEVLPASSNITDVIHDTLRNSDSDKINRLVNCDFYRSSTLNGAIPTDTLISDRLGVYVAENNDLNCIEFCMTWQDTDGTARPIDFDLVSRFNHGIFLYDRSLIKEYSAYEVGDDYDVNDSVSINNWVIMHFLELEYYGREDNNRADTVLYRENYNMTQSFGIINDPKVVFYYRPLFADPGLVEKTSYINVRYITRLMNLRDSVQFMNEGTLSIAGNLNRFYINTAVTNYTDLIPFKIYNKIVETKHEVKKSTNIVPKVKYVKVFYDSTDIVLEGNSGTYYSSDSIVVKLSQVPKNYKFVLKNRKSDGVYDYMDLSEGYYKLYAKDSNNNEIIIEPTYSSNMNMLLGELEFNITNSVLAKLRNVDPALRKMSLIVQNEDNSLSSMFDFMYEF